MCTHSVHGAYVACITHTRCVDGAICTRSVLGVHGEHVH
jgi:hypothetical protein